MNDLLGVLFRLHRRWLRLRGALTLGTRVVVLKDDSVLLVRLTYSSGWHLPGGGVEHGETFLEGARRELREECGLDSPSLELHGIYVNRLGRHVDHIAVFVAPDLGGEPRIQDSREIADVRFFPLNHLPEDLLPAQRRRLDEVTKHHSSSPRHGSW